MTGAVPPGLHRAGAVHPPSQPYDADIILLALDRIEETEQAIASVFRQAGCRWHLTIIDQGSTPANLSRLADAMLGRADAGLFASGVNLGVAGGRNLASAVGHGRVIVALDNDAEFFDAATAARAVAAIDAEPDVAAIAFRILVHASGDDDLTSWGFPKSLLPRAAGQFDVPTFVGAGHAIRRSAWDDAGGYDPALFFCWEEFDFSLRAIARGWRILYRGDIAVRHRASAEGRVTWSDRRWFYFVRNRLYIARKWSMPWPKLLPRIAAYLFKGARHGLFGTSVRAIAEAVRMSRQPASVAARRVLPPRARDYLRRNDTAHRGHAGARLRAEVLARLPIENFSASSIGSTAGLSSK